MPREMLIAPIVLAAALTLPAAAAGAGSAHSLHVAVSNNAQHFGRHVPMTEGEDHSYSGEQKMRNFEFNGALTRTGRKLKLSYRVGITGTRADGEKSLVAEGGLFVSPGARVTAVTCGPWTIAFTLDREKGRRPRMLDGAAGLKSLGNYRIGARLRQGERARCSVVSAPDTEASVSDFMQVGEERRGLSLWLHLSGAPSEGLIPLDYRAEDNFSGDLEGTSSSGSLLVVPGKKAIAEGEEGAPGPVFLVEGAPPARTGSE